MSISNRPDFRKNDIELFQTGNFADGSIKCKDRTWKVHRLLLASRLKFFKAAFYGLFSEAESGEVDFPDEDPIPVELMLRHLYGEDLDVKDLKTPLLCVRCWKLADYVQLESLRFAATSSLQSHFDAMALMASCNWSFEKFRPIWMGHFFDAFWEVCSNVAMEPLQPLFSTFLWVTRCELLLLSETLEILAKWPVFNKRLVKLLASNKLVHRPDWVPDTKHIERAIQNKTEMTFESTINCSRCNKKLNTREHPIFYNPFPVGHSQIGQLMWCKICVEKFKEELCWPWRNGGGLKGDKVKLAAWTW